MIKTQSAWTVEVDDGELAIKEIKSRLDLNGLGRNTIGIVACHYEFVLSGVLKAVCDALPFEVAGVISSSQSVNGKTGSLLLTLMVLTGDGVEFVTAQTPSLQTEPEKAITETYESVRRKERPALIFTFAPFMLQNAGDDYVNILTRISGGAPCFGSLAVDDTEDYSNCFMVNSRGYFRDEMSMVLVYGDISPKFFIANISDNKILDATAVVTKSAGPLIMEVNGRPITDFFENYGLIKAAETQYALSTLPFLLDYNDGSPKVSKIFVGLTPERYAICAGAVPQGCTLYVTSSDKDDVLFTTGEVMGRLLGEAGNISGMLAYSCISRGMALGAEQFSEMDLVTEKIGGRFPFMVAYSGGEICPTRVTGSGAVNRFHNNAFVVCLF